MVDTADVDAIWGLTDRQRKLTDTATQIAREEIAPAAAELDRNHEFPYSLLATLGEHGLLGVPYSTELGGGGGNTLAYAMVVEALGCADQSVALSVAAHTSLGTYPIWKFGSDDQKETWLPDLCSGRRLASFGIRACVRLGESPAMSGRAPDSMATAG